MWNRKIRGYLETVNGVSKEEQGTWLVLVEGGRFDINKRTKISIVRNVKNYRNSRLTCLPL